MPFTPLTPSPLGDKTQPEKPGYFERVKGRLVERGEAVAEDIVRPDISRTAGASPLEVTKQIGEAGLRTAGQFAGAVFDPLMEAPGVKEATEFVGEKLAGTETMKKYAGWAQKHPDAAKDIEAVLDIAGLFGLGKGAKVGAEAVEAGAKATREAAVVGAEKAVKVGIELVEQGKKIIEPPKPSALQAAGQVLQGKTKDIKAGVRALKELDTAGVKTFDDLAQKAGTRIEELAAGVDEALDNTVGVKLKDLVLTGKTTAGKAVSVDYVSRALNQLKEMYGKIGDAVRMENIDEVLAKAKTGGLTRKEVNDIARTYGQEFGQKAFGKTGEALTSVSAQAYEHTRRALKAVARKGIKGEAAKAMDEAMSDLYRLKDLVRKNAEAANKLAQKIQERGLLEKVGYKASKYLDVLTGGGIRGVVGGLLPRGVGYKVMNALDLQAVLERNLKIVQDALKAGDEELIKLLRKEITEGSRP